MTILQLGPTRRRLGAALALTVAIAAVGCGGDEEDGATTRSSGPAPAASTSGKLALRADPARLTYDKRALSAPAGKVTIVMSNPSEIPHDVAIEGNGVDAAGETVKAGGTSSVTADLKPGNYSFYCSVGSHRQAGMEGTLTVK